MKPNRFLLLVLLLCTSFLAKAQREVISLNGDWQFTDSVTVPPTTIQVPHCWQSEGMAGYRRPETKTCTYEKTIEVSAYQGKRLFLKFEGVNKIAVVKVDGQEVGRHEGGYSTFYVEITDVALGKTEVKVRVDVTNVNPATMPVRSDFTQYAGIYRDVALVAVNPDVCISNQDDGSNGVYLHYTLKEQEATLCPTIVLDSKAEGTAHIVTVIKNADGKVVATAKQDVTLDGTRGQAINLNSFTLGDTHLWGGTKAPYLYTALVKVKYNDEEVDRVSQKIGFRSLMVKNGKFYLNGSEYPVHGVGMHQDYDTRTNVTTAAQREADINTVIEMGANAMRLSHYPHNQHTYDLCDEKGLLVWCEIPFSTEMLGTDEFRNHALQSAREMVKQGLHHPSIIIWGIANEVQSYGHPDEYPDEADKDQINDFLKVLSSTVKSIDASRFVGLAQLDNTTYVKQTAEGIDADTNLSVIGFNPYKGWYSTIDGATEANKITYITKKLKSALSSYRTTFNAASSNTLSYVVTEYGAGGNINQHDDLGVGFAWAGKNGKKGYQTVGNYHPEEYQSFVHEGDYMALYGDNTNSISAAPGIWASFAWCMFDFSCYRDEGGLERTNTKGLVTADRKTRKDAFYFYKAHWNQSDPFAHICSKRYTQRQGDTITVKVYSNCADVRLVVNGRDLGQGTPVQDGVFEWRNVRLLQKNSVRAIATQGGVEYTDQVDTWTAPVSPLGDLNADGRITVTDLTLLVKALLADVVVYDPRLDINHDGEVDAADVTALLEIILYAQ